MTQGLLHHNWQGKQKQSQLKTYKKKKIGSNIPEQIKKKVKNALTELYHL